MPTVTSIPLFQKYTLDELERRTPYSAIYLLNIRDGRKRLTPRFREVMTLVLGESDATLFATTEGR